MHVTFRPGNPGNPGGPINPGAPGNPGGPCNPVNAGSPFALPTTVSIIHCDVDIIEVKVLNFDMAFAIAAGALSNYANKINLPVHW